MKPAVCIKAVIVGVDPTSHRCTIKHARDGESQSQNVHLGASYANAVAGSGNFSLPAEGSDCFVMVPSDGSSPFVVSYTMPPGPGEGLTGGRIPMDPGDQAMTGDERNFVIARADGTVEIGSTGLCKSIYFPLGNILDTYFEELNWVTGLGGLQWTGASGEALYEFRAALQPEKAATVYVKAGTTRGVHAQFPNTQSAEGVVLEVVVDPEGAGKVFGFHVGEDGTFSTESDGGGALRIKGSWEGEIQDYVKLLVKKTVDVTALGNVALEAPNVTVAAKQEFTATAGKQLTLGAPAVSIGNGSLTPAVRSKELVLLLQQMLLSLGRPDLIATLPWSTITSKIVKVA